MDKRLIEITLKHCSCFSSPPPKKTPKNYVQNYDDPIKIVENEN